MDPLIGFKSPGMGCWCLVTFQKCQFCIFSNLPVHGNVKFPELSSEGNKSEVKIGREATFHPTRRPVSIKMTDLGSRAKILVYFSQFLVEMWLSYCLQNSNRNHDFFRISALNLSKIYVDFYNLNISRRTSENYEINGREIVKKIIPESIFSSWVVWGSGLIDHILNIRLNGI